MSDFIDSVVDGDLLLPTEQMTPDNISLLQQYAGTITDIETFMSGVRTAVYNYQAGYTAKIVLNPSDVQTYLSRIRSITVRIGGGYDEDGLTVVTPLSTNVLPDLLMTLRDAALWLCRLYALYEDSQGVLVGPLDKVTIESTAGEGDIV